MRTTFVLALFALPLAAADWIRVQTPSVTLYTDAGEKAAQSTIARLNDLRALFAQGTRQDPSPASLEIYVFGSASEFRALADSPRIAGFYRSGPGYEIIAIHSTPDARRTLAHEYVHLLLAHSRPVHWPAWLEEGMAEFYSTLSVNAKGATLGEGILSHRAKLGNSRWLTADELTSAQADQEGEKDGMVYAQGWALVHMLNLAPAYREHVADYFTSLLAGDDPAEAFARVFGRTLDQAITELRGYVSQMKSIIVEGPRLGNGDTPIVSRLTRSQAIVVRAELALRTGHFALARGILAESPATQESPELEAARGLLAGAERDPAAAIQHLERAIALGSREGSVRFELALRKQEAAAPSAEVDRLLREAVEIDRSFPDARFLLGVRLTDAGDIAGATKLLTEATVLRPRQSSYWHALAFALERAGQRQAALDAAVNAVRTAQSVSEEAMAETLRDHLRKGL
jgi:tetratricopeptide (TPR) repeat protein